jgi:hypothetical protein
VEIERVCNRADEGLLETAAVSIKPSGGGPEQLAILAVLKDKSAPYDANLLKSKFQRAIQRNLNPLFKVRASFFWTFPVHTMDTYAMRVGIVCLL